MRNRLLILLFVVGGWIAPVSAQVSPAAVQPIVSANLTAQAASCPAATSTGALVMTLPTGTGSAALGFAGTWSGTNSFFISQDHRATFVALNATPPNSSTAVSTTTGNGSWKASVGGYTDICVAMTTYSSGTAVVTVSTSPASASSGGGSSSGGTVTAVSGTANQIDSTGGAAPVLSLDSAVRLTGSISATAGFGGTTTVDCAGPFVAQGADDSLTIQNCLAYLQSANSVAGIADARRLTGLTWSVNPFSATRPTSGVLLLPPGVTVTSLPIVQPKNWRTIGVQAKIGSTVQASSSFKHTYSTGTVTKGTAGLNDTITGSGTTWSTNVVPGCAFVGAATFPNGNNTYGIIKTVSSNTSITLAWGVDTGSGAGAGSAYGIFCPVWTQGDGSDDGTGYTYGSDVENLVLDANNVAGVVPLLNWFGAHPSHGEWVTFQNFCTMGLQVEGLLVQGVTYSNITAHPGSCGTTSTIPFMIAPVGGALGFFNLDGDQGGSGSNPAVSTNIEGSGVDILNVEADNATVGVSINNDTACGAPCAHPDTFGGGVDAAIKVENVYGGSTTTGVHIGNGGGAGHPKAITVLNVPAVFGTNVLVDDNNSCTVSASAEHLASYVLNQGGALSFSSSTAANCQASPQVAAMVATGGNNVGSTITYGEAQCESSFGTTTVSGGATKTTGQTCLPANSVIIAVKYRITTTITTAASFTIGDGGSATRYCGTQSTLTAGTTGICNAQGYYFNSGALGVLFTPNTTPGAGAVRFTVDYITLKAPTS